MSIEKKIKRLKEVGIITSSNRLNGYINKEKLLSIPEYEQIKECVGRTFGEQVYCYIHDIAQIPICKNCGKNFCKYVNMTVGHIDCCSNKCSHEYKTHKCRKTCLEKYGVENVAQLLETKVKMKETCLQRYGVYYASQTNTFKQHVKETCLEKYGVENVLQSIHVIDKVKETCLQRYGVDWISKSTKYKNSIAKNCRKRRYSFILDKLKQKKLSLLVSEDDFINSDYVTLKCLRCRKDFFSWK